MAFNFMDSDNIYNHHSHVDHRSESLRYYYSDQGYSSTLMEKRQLFLRSYQFCTKKSVPQKINASLLKIKRVIWVRLKNLLLHSCRLRNASRSRRRRSVRLHHPIHSLSCFS
ncbi:hypothetical protein SDJN03_15946, partial [Cucurbita argyrosperma subsp. sororia]